MWIGNSERNLHDALRAGPAQPALRAVLRRGRCAGRQPGRHAASRRPPAHQPVPRRNGRREATNDGVLILAATNAPWHVDSAFRRPGPLRPDPVCPAAGRRRARRDPAPALPGQAGGGNRFRASGKKTEGFSGADLKAVVDVAIEGKLQEAMKSGVPQPLSPRTCRRRRHAETHDARNGLPRPAITRSIPIRAASTTIS